MQNVQTEPERCEVQTEKKKHKQKKKNSEIEVFLHFKNI